MDVDALLDVVGQVEMRVVEFGRRTLCLRLDRGAAETDSATLVTAASIAVEGYQALLITCIASIRNSSRD